MFELLQSAIFIFALRVTDISLYMVRIMMVVRGRKALAWAFGFCQAFVYVFAIRAVLTNLSNPLNLMGYAAGFATGNVVGMLIEGRLAVGHLHLRIISPGFGEEIAEHLRDAGFGATELAGRGKDGTVYLISCNILRREKDRVIQLIQQVDEGAFITAEDIRQVRHGFWG